MPLEEDEMKKNILLVIAGGITVFSQTGQESEPFERLDNSAFEKPVRPAAVFDHDIHNEMAELEDDCAVCHHVYDEDNQLVEDESSEDSLCSDCHYLKSDADNTVSLRKAYHKRCKSCHFAEKKGPVLCGECHINQTR